jgi:hypothetical protein
MTGITGTVTALAAAVAVALSGTGSDQHGAQGTALVIDAGTAPKWGELIDPRLLDVDAEVRLPRDSWEARINVRYFDALGYRVVVVGPRSSEAAEATGVEALHAADLPQALTLP